MVENMSSSNLKETKIFDKKNSQDISKSVISKHALSIQL